MIPSLNIRWSTENAEAAISDLVGANRITQTVKANADAIQTTYMPELDLGGLFISE